MVMLAKALPDKVRPKIVRRLEPRAHTLWPKIAPIDAVLGNAVVIETLAGGHRPRQTHRQHIIDQGTVPRRPHTPRVEVADLALDRSLTHTQLGAPRTDIAAAAGPVAPITRALPPPQPLNPLAFPTFLPDTIGLKPCWD